MRTFFALAFLGAFAFLATVWSGFDARAESVRTLAREFPRLDTGKRSVELREIQSGGPPRDGIPAISNPSFHPANAESSLSSTEPMITVSGLCAAKAYPLSVLMWHEIVNDTLCGVPIAVTYCPLCNSAAVFDRKLDGRVLEFGTSGRLLASNLVMYDRQTETLWQQFTGDAIVGELTGTKLRMRPARIESFAAFVARHPDGVVMTTPEGGKRNYGANPYVGYDRSSRPMLYNGRSPPGVDPLARVVRVADRAWTLDRVRREQRIETADGLVIEWSPGQNSALDTSQIARGRDVGNVIVRKNGEDVPYSVDFAFAFDAFYPGKLIEK